MYWIVSGTTPLNLPRRHSLWTAPYCALHYTKDLVTVDNILIRLQLLGVLFFYVKNTQSFLACRICHTFIEILFSLQKIPTQPRRSQNNLSFFWTKKRLNNKSAASEHYNLSTTTRTLVFLGCRYMLLIVLLVFKGWNRLHYGQTIHSTKKVYFNEFVQISLHCNMGMIIFDLGGC